MKDFLEKKNVFIEKVAQFEKKMNVLKKNSTTAQKAYFINEFQKVKTPILPATLSTHLFRFT